MQLLRRRQVAARHLVAKIEVNIGVESELSGGSRGRTVVSTRPTTDPGILGRSRKGRHPISWESGTLQNFFVSSKFRTMWDFLAYCILRKILKSTRVLLTVMSLRCVL